MFLFLYYVDAILCIMVNILLGGYPSMKEKISNSKLCKMFIIKS